MAYKVRALAVLSCVGMLTPPPKIVRHMEDVALRKVLRAAFHSLAIAAMNHAHEMGACDWTPLAP
eukprot:3528836-Alexandrium_andersonii.AAC.1